MVRLFVLAIGLFLSLSPTFAITITADSVTITTADPANTTSFTVQFDGNSDQTDVPGLTGQATFILTAFSGNTASFDVVLVNTSSAPVTASRISVLGFDTNPDLVSATSTSPFNQVAYNSSLPNQFGSIEVCFKGGGGPSCDGGGGGGPTLGQQINFDITLTFSGPNPTTSFTLDNFGVRYQSIDAPGIRGGSGTGTGCLIDCEDPGDPGDGVPEPASMMLIGGGLVGLGLFRRFRKA